MAGAGAGAGAEKRDKNGAGAENKLFRLPNTAKKRLSQYFLETDVFCTCLFANKLVMYEYIQ